MADDEKGVMLVILGVVSVVAIVGLILLFAGQKSVTGNAYYDVQSRAFSGTNDYQARLDNVGSYDPGYTNSAEHAVGMAPVTGSDKYGYNTQFGRVDNQYGSAYQ